MPFELSSFDGFSFDTIIAGLRHVQGFLAGLDLGILNTDLPLIDINLNELFVSLHFGSFINETASTPAGSLQIVEELIEDLLQLPDADGRVIFELPQLNAAFGRPELNEVPGNPDADFFEQVEYLRSLQVDNSEVTISLDRSKVVRHIGDFFSARELIDDQGQAALDPLNKLFDKLFGAQADSLKTQVADASQSVLWFLAESIEGIQIELPGSHSVLTWPTQSWPASPSANASMLIRSSPGIQVPINLDLEQFMGGLGFDLPELVDLRGQSLLTLDAGAELGISLGWT